MLDNFYGKYVFPREIKFLFYSILFYSIIVLGKETSSLQNGFRDISLYA
jgi:hypothetical protein